MKKNNLIIFDFYGVLAGEIAPNFFRNHFEEENASILKEKYFKPADLGEYDLKELFTKMAQDLGFSYEEIYNEFKSYIKPNDELFEYLLKLKKTNYVALLSNAVKGLFKAYFPNLDFNKYFDKHFISAYYGLAKPDFKFYELCVNSFNIKFDNIIMIDDKIYNVKDLYKIGIKGIQFKNNKELFSELDKYL